MPRYLVLFHSWEYASGQVEHVQIHTFPFTTKTNAKNKLEALIKEYHSIETDKEIKNAKKYGIYENGNIRIELIDTSKNENECRSLDLYCSFE